MYPPYSDDVDQSFAMRVLSLMDDEIAVENLNIEWKEKKMKLQFKHQPFQAEAAAAVCDVFNGQPMRTTSTAWTWAI